MVSQRAAGILFRKSKRGVRFDENCRRRQVETQINRTVVRVEDRKGRDVYFGVRRYTVSDVVRRKGFGNILRDGKKKEGEKVIPAAVEVGGDQFL